MSVINKIVIFWMRDTVNLLENIKGGELRLPVNVVGNGIGNQR